MVNIDLLNRIIDHIEQHPETWDQRAWAQKTECGTAFCVAGHAVNFAYPDLVAQAVGIGNLYLPDHESWRKLGVEALELDFIVADILFSSDNTLDEIKAIRDALAQNPDIGAEALCELLGRDLDDY